MREAIRQRARELGFELCGFTTANPPESAPRLEAWLAQEYHGEMGYLARNARKRSEPQKVLAGAKSIVALAASYAQEEETRIENRSEWAGPRVKQGAGGLAH